MEGFVTIEAANSHLAALKTEKVGYQARIAGIKNGKPDLNGLDEKALTNRIGEVDEQIKLMTKKLGAAEKEQAVPVEVPEAA